MAGPMGTRPTVIQLEKGVPGVDGPDPSSYREFWAFYLSQHLHPMTRRVHAAATVTAVITGVTGILSRKWKVVAASPLLAYGPAFASHWIWEKNSPVVLNKGKPVWAAMADLEMVFKVLAGAIDEDVADVRAAAGPHPHQVTLADRERLRAAA